MNVAQLNNNNELVNYVFFYFAEPRITGIGTEINAEILVHDNPSY